MGQEAYRNGGRLPVKQSDDLEAMRRRGMAAIGKLEQYELDQLSRRAEQVLDEMDRMKNGTQL